MINTNSQVHQVHQKRDVFVGEQQICQERALKCADVSSVPSCASRYLRVCFYKTRKDPAALTLFDVSLLAAEPLGKLLAVPHQQLLIGFHRSDGVEVDVSAVLACHQVLFDWGAGRVDVAHPVAPVDIIAINEILKLPTVVNLKEKKRVVMGLKDVHRNMKNIHEDQDVDEII